MILKDSVQPPWNVYLTVLPPEFVVPVKVFDPSLPIACNVFVDFYPDQINNTGTAGPCSVPPGLEGGIAQAQFSVSPFSLNDPNACHTIQCFVAQSFQSNSAHTPAGSVPADSITWQYAPNGPGGCDEFDAGDGAFPPADALMDGLPITPDAI